MEDGGEEDRKVENGNGHINEGCFVRRCAGACLDPASADMPGS
ncbi:MAG: hypothetical protein ABSG35_20835 [Syntrophobacteraceae bacterium]